MGMTSNLRQLPTDLLLFILITRTIRMAALVGNIKEEVKLEGQVLKEAFKFFPPLILTIVNFRD
jgi:hypothetical protein